MPCLRIALLGAFTCQADDGSPLNLPGHKTEALLAYLAAPPSRRHSRDRLAGLLWEDMPTSQARANLRKALSRLRQALPPAAQESLVVTPQALGLYEGLVEVDLAAFECHLAEATPETLESALALYRGPFLEGMIAGGEAFEEWLLAQRRWLDEQCHQARHRLLEHYVATGAIDSGIQIALRLLEEDPLDEGAQRTLIRLYLYQDRVGAALAQYRECRERLAEELDITPAPETEQLWESLQVLLPGGSAGLSREDDLPPESPGVIERAAEERARRREPTGRPSIAVLAFATDEACQRHLGDGLAEDIATELGRFSELEVIAPTSALAYRDASVPPQRIGEELGVGYIVSGRCRRHGTRLRLTVQLLGLPEERLVWAEHYDDDLDAHLEIQDEIVDGLVGSLADRIGVDRLARTRRKPPQDWQAYELWLLGWHALRRPDLPAIHEARRLFQLALDRDPHFARAYVGLAQAHLDEWACYAWNHWTFLQDEALALGRQAVALDEHDQRAHCMLGLAELYAQHYVAAQGELHLALALNPNDADVLAHASFALALAGETDRGVAAARRALRLAPYRPDWYAGMAGIALFSARHYEEAIATMAAAPQAFCNTPAFIAAAHAHLGQPEQATGHRDTVYRHYRYQLARGNFPRETSCLEWLTALDPYRRRNDAEHYLEGLHLAGFE